MRTRMTSPTPILRRALSVACAVTIIACTGTPTSDAPQQPPNIVLVSIDSLRADHLGAYGYEKPTSPFIDRLAKEGIAFESAISSTSWTLPAHAALFTGLADSAHSTLTPKSRLSDDYETLAEILGEHGYTTLALYSGPFLHPDFGLDQGFDRYIDCTSLDLESRDPRKSHAASHRDITNPVLLSKARDEFDALGPEPYFLFLHMWDVHYDLIPPKKYRGMFDKSYSGSFDGRDFRHEPGFKVGMDKADFAHVLALYDAEIRYTDDTLAKILGLLEQVGKLENTMIVITSDHGDEFLEHGGKGHRHSLFQEVIHIPLVFWMPGRVSEARIAVPVSITDIAPTLLDLAGARPIRHVMGRSLLPALTGAELSPRPVLSELVAPPRAPNMSAVLQGSGKLIVDHTRNTATYYDLSIDPDELVPLPAAESREAAALLEQMIELKKRSLLIAAAHSGTPAIDLPDGTRERLEILGYLE
jgi:arylsulfatase A-like enzyme